MTNTLFNEIRKHENQKLHDQNWFDFGEQHKEEIAKIDYLHDVEKMTFSEIRYQLCSHR